MKPIKFGFQVTNNIIEYKAPVAGLLLAKRIGVKNLKAYSDLELVVPNLTKYHDLIKKLI